jgi:3-polyprenyl-4-hydroxybenzoate decarboxylase
MPTNDGEMLSVSRVARELDRDVTTVRNYIDRGLLPAIRLSGLGGRWGMRAVRRRDVEEFRRTLTENKIAGTRAARRRPPAGRPS